MISICCLGKKGFVSIARLNKSYYSSIDKVVIGTDKNVQNDYSNDLKSFCEKNDLPYVVTNDTSKITSKYIIAIGWRWLINMSDGSNSSIIVFHDSILPQYRGFNPLVSCLINEEPQIGVTALEASHTFDAGPIYDQLRIDIQYPIKIAEAIELLSYEYAKLLNVVLGKVLSNTLRAREQAESEVTYSLWRDDQDYAINWNHDSNEIKRFIDAVGYPYKGAYSSVAGKKVIILDSEVYPDVPIVNRCPGKVLFKEKTSFIIVCGSGLLKVNDFFDEEGHRIEMKKFRLRFE